MGDSAADMAAGRAAGVTLCAVDYGYGNQEEMLRYKPDFWISDLRELSSSPGTKFASGSASVASPVPPEPVAT